MGQTVRYKYGALGDVEVRNRSGTPFSDSGGLFVRPRIAAYRWRSFVRKANRLFPGHAFVPLSPEIHRLFRNAVILAPRFVDDSLLGRPRLAVELNRSRGRLLPPPGLDIKHKCLSVRNPRHSPALRPSDFKSY